MNKQCVQCNKTFQIDDRDQAFYARISVPVPTHCSSCRLQRRLAFRNERNFYSRPCDLCQKPIITVYAPDSPRQRVFCLQCWWSDNWDATDYARDIDFSRPFFEQYQELANEIPAVALMNDNGIQSQNCEYTYDFAFGKDCYMVISSWRDENCMYGFQINWSKDLFDCFFVFNSELNYEGVVLEKCFNTAYVTNSRDCRDVIFGYDLRGCSNCLFSSGLRNKEYYIWNKQYTKEEYEKRKAQFGLDKWSNVQKYKAEFQQFILKQPRRFANLMNCENSTGDNLVRAGNSQDCYLYYKTINSRYCAYGDGTTDSYDIDHSGSPEMSYESVTPDNSYQALFTIYCWKSQCVQYSENCHSSKELFGCVGMKKGKYAILNKTYDEKQYAKLKKKLIAHMQTTGEYGEFFPVALSPFAYNESAAQQYVPMNTETVHKFGYRWKDDLPHIEGKQTLTDIPDSIHDVDASISTAVLSCQSCGQNYKLQKAEFEFYQRMEIPVPQWCIDCRYHERVQRINPQQLWHRQCMCTQPAHDHGGRDASGHAGSGGGSGGGNAGGSGVESAVQQCPREFETTYAPERKEIVYCEQCYQKEMY